MTDERRAVTVDEHTGEVFDGVFVYVPKKARTERWVMAFQEACVNVAQDPDFTKATYRVWNIILGRLDFENYIVLNQAEVANTLGMQRPNVARQIRLLVNKGLLQRGPKSGQQVTFRINPNYVWRGTAKNLHPARKSFQGFQVIDGGQADDQQQLDIERDT